DRAVDAADDPPPGPACRDHGVVDRRWRHRLSFPDRAARHAGDLPRWDDDHDLGLFQFDIVRAGQARARSRQPGRFVDATTRDRLRALAGDESSDGAQSAVELDRDHDPRVDLPGDFWIGRRFRDLLLAVEADPGVQGG